MADPSQILTALRNADAAGDTAGAQRLAQLYKQATAQPGVLSDMARSFGSGLTHGVASAADTVASFIPGLNVLEHATQGSPIAPDLLHHPTGTFFQKALGAIDPNSQYTPQTTPGQYARTVGQFAPAALAPGSLAARAANVFVPALTSETAGQVAHRMGASPQVEQAARFGGALAGGVAASARIGSAAPPTPDEQVANLFAQRAKADPEAMTSQAAQMRESGVDPTLTDVTGTPGQRLIKAVGITNDQAGETLQSNARSLSATTKPAAMADTRALVSDAQTPEHLSAALKLARSQEAQTKYAAPYAQPVTLDDPHVIEALRDPEGIGAINRAIAGARTRMDQGALADLQALKATATGPTGDGQVWPTTGRALDRVQIAMGNRADQLEQSGAGDIASGFRMRQARINGLLDSVDGLQEARAAFRAKSQALDVLNKPSARMDPFSTDPGDYADWIKSLSPEARKANQLAVRQDVLDTLGGQRANTFGTLDELASSAYSRPNLSAVFGKTTADRYVGSLAARLQQTRNATQVSPYAGSPTKMLQNDTSILDRGLDLADTVGKAKAGNVIGLVGKLSTYLKTRGISDQQAQELAKASVDPSRLDGVIRALQARVGPKAVSDYLNFRGGLIGAATGQARVAGPTPAQAPQ